MASSLSGKVAVVTGASMGIGEAIARRLVQHGTTVVLTSRDQARVQAACNAIGIPDRTLAVPCDVRNAAEMRKLARDVSQRFGKLDIWVNNAGYGLRDTVSAMDPDAMRELFETNLFGALYGMQAAAAIMLEQGNGVIVNISSVAGHIPLPNGGAYSASKFAMNALGKAARMELADRGVHVLTVCPGYIDTEFGRNRVRGREAVDLREKPAGVTADVVAEATLRGILRRKRELVVPGHYRLFIKAYQLLPGIMESVLIGMARKAQARARAAARSAS
jgi:short-subunit dehydrogenase